jgi:hypothetical protein
MFLHFGGIHWDGASPTSGANWRRINNSLTLESICLIACLTVVRVCGSEGINSEEIIEWEMRVSEETYFLSVISDFFAEALWRPERILPKVLVADLFGRALATFNRSTRLGAAALEDGDLMGDGVTIAARLEGIAEPGAIRLSEDAYRQVSGRLDMVDATIEFVGLNERDAPSPSNSRPSRCARTNAGAAAIRCRARSADTRPEGLQFVPPTRPFARGRQRRTPEILQPRWVP